MRRYSVIILALGCCAALISACEQKRGDAAPEPSDELKQGLKQTGDALKRGAEKAGAAIAEGVEKVAPAVEEKVKDLGQTIEHEVQKAGPAIEKGVKKVGQAIEQGVKAAGAELSANDSEKPTAAATFKSRKNTDLGGEAAFYEKDGAVRIVVKVSDARPGEHAVHIHENGDCSDLKGKSTGAHFDRKQHDLGNMDVDSDGTGQLETSVPRATLKPGKTTLMGKAIVIHAAKGDGKAKSGNSGDAIACGVIGSKTRE